jgi:hypothetical protein
MCGESKLPFLKKSVICNYIGINASLTYVKLTNAKRFEKSNFGGILAPNPSKDIRPSLQTKIY